MIRRTLTPFAILALTAAAAPAQLQFNTLFAGGNGGSTNGAVYFDVTVKIKTTLQGFDCNFGQTLGTPVGLQVYFTPDTRVGKEADVNLWQLVGEDDGSTLAAGPDEPTRFTLLEPIDLEPGTFGVALVAVDANHRYTDGTGTNQNYEDAFLSAEFGTASNAAFTAPLFDPRVWNGSLLYGTKALKGPFLYAYDDENDQINAYWLEKKSGQPAHIATSPFAVTGGDAGCGGNCQTLAADPKGAFLFAGTASGLAVLRRLEEGALEEVAGSPFAGSGELLGVAAWRKGKVLRVFAVSNTTGHLNVFDIDADTGEATLQANPPTIGSVGGGVGIAVTKSFVYAVNQNDGNFHGFTIDDATGAPTAMGNSPFSILGITDPFNLVVDSKGKMLAVNDCDDGDYGFALIDKTTGEPLFPVVIPGASSCSEAIGFSSKGNFYGGGENIIDVFSKTPALIGSPIIPGGGLNLGALHTKGTAVYFADGVSLFYLPIDKSTALPVPGQALGLIGTFVGDPTGMVVVKK